MIKEAKDVSKVAQESRFNDTTQRMIFLFSSDSPDKMFGTYKMMGLLLEKILSCSNDRFRRIGYFEIRTAYRGSTLDTASSFKSYLSSIPEKEVTIL